MYFNTGLFLFLSTLVGDSKQPLERPLYYSFQACWKCKAVNQQAASPTLVSKESQPRLIQSPRQRCISQSQHWHNGGILLLFNRCSLSEKFRNSHLSPKSGDIKGQEMSTSVLEPTGMGPQAKNYDCPPRRQRRNWVWTELQLGENTRNHKGGGDSEAGGPGNGFSQKQLVVLPTSACWEENLHEIIHFFHRTANICPLFMQIGYREENMVVRPKLLRTRRWRVSAVNHNLHWGDWVVGRNVRACWGLEKDLPPDQ